MKIYKLTQEAQMANTIPEATVQYLNQFLRAIDEINAQLAQSQPNQTNINTYFAQLNSWRDGMRSLVNAIANDPSVSKELKALISMIQATINSAIGSRRDITREELTRMRNTLDAIRTA